MPRRAGRKTDYEWNTITGVITALDINAEALGSGTLVIAIPGTHARVRGRVFAQLDATAVDERATVVVGLRYATDDAVAAGVSALGNPFDDPDNDWLWTGHLFVSSGAEGAVVNEFLGDRIEIESKAMRRVKPGSTLAFVAVTPSAGAVDQGGTVDILFSYRALLGT